MYSMIVLYLDSGHLFTNTDYSNLLNDTQLWCTNKLSHDYSVGPSYFFKKLDIHLLFFSDLKYIHEAAIK